MAQILSGLAAGGSSKLREMAMVRWCVPPHHSLGTTHVHDLLPRTQIDDESAMRRAAADRATEDGLTQEEANEYLTAEWKSLADCVVMLLDPGQSPPGTSVLDSSVEESDDLTG